MDGVGVAPRQIEAVGWLGCPWTPFQHPTTTANWNGGFRVSLRPRTVSTFWHWLMSDFIVIDRAMMDHPVVGIHKPKRFAAWAWMISKARWKRSPGTVNDHPITLERGQFSCSIRFMAQRVGMTVQELRTLLIALKTNTMINTAVVEGQTVITICNYDKYQSVRKNRTVELTQPETQEQHSFNTASTQTRTKEPRNQGKEGNPPAPFDNLFDDKEKPDGPKPRKRRTAIPEDWKPTPNHHELGQREGYAPAEVEWLADDFRDWTVNGKGYTNWNAAFSTSLRSDISRRKIAEKRKMSRGGRGSPSVVEECARQASMVPVGGDGESTGTEEIDHEGDSKAGGLDGDAPWR